MSDWTKVVKHPLGLAGYAVAITFALAGKYGASSRWPWLFPVSVAMAIIALLGGILLAWQSTEKGKTKGDSQRPSTIQQTTKGANSPAIGNVGRDVNVSYGEERKKK